MICMCREFKVDSAGYTDMHDLTGQVQQVVSQAGLAEGIATVFTPGSTASLTTIEFESGAVSDLKEAIRRAAPEDKTYQHNERWGDGNGFSHVRAALGGPSLTVPVAGGLLVLGTWQQIVLLDHDNGSRKRKVVVQLMGTD
jgi:secondary thiamine-phosphate synthase enzyme